MVHRLLLLGRFAVRPTGTLHKVRKKRDGRQGRSVDDILTAVANPVGRQHGGYDVPLPTACIVSVI